MSDIAIGPARRISPFGIGAIALMLLLGIGGFVGLLVLGAYAPDLRSGRNGGGHALSDSATGFSAIVKLAKATGRNPTIVRNEHEFSTENLLIVTPETPFIDMSPVLTQRQVKPTLIVLPKWNTRADQKHKGWVDWVGLVPLSDPIGVLAPDINFTMAQHRSGGSPLVSEGLPRTIRFRSPRPVQVITGLRTRDDDEFDDEDDFFNDDGAGTAEPAQTTNESKANSDRATQAQQAANVSEGADDVPGNTSEDSDGAGPAPHWLTPLITDGSGGIVLARIDDRPLYVLADPDLLSNLGMQNVDQAAAALALLDWMNSNPPDGVAFDVSLNGFGHSKSPLKLMFEPPFLAVTIAIAAALILAGIQAFARFGPPRARNRALAFGKAALVDNSALLVRKAGREGKMASRYAAVIRERAVATFGISSRLRDGALDAYLDRLEGRRRFTELAQIAEAAEDRETVLIAARALHQWQKEKMK